VSGAKQRFGGDWTTEKLERVRKYLAAYATIMTKQRFRFAYIDAFAGTGYNTVKADIGNEMTTFEELASPEALKFIDGSARIALRVEPRFDKYIFIEKNPARFAELEKLRDEFPDRAKDIIPVKEDANRHITELCLNRRWDKHRAVLFLDPFGMQVTWETVSAVAETHAIDLWLLFPLGVAVNRMLTRDGKISETWQHRLDEFFGVKDWRDVFYQTRTETSLFGEEERTEKIADLTAIGAYFVGRLKTIFAGVANNPLALRNSTNTPLYLLCFAAGNPKGAKTAVKIAQDILRK
jgi:three-Cys-motif partner protein